MRPDARTLLLLATLLPASTMADGGSWGSFQIHGFASQALVYTSDNRFFGDSPNTSFDFTEIGINTSVRPHPRILLSGQLLYRRAGDIYADDLSLDYALADITALSTPQGRAGLRLGRIKNPLGLYNETRDVPFTRPSIFLPQAVYFDKVRNLVLSSDGVAVYGDWFGAGGDISMSLSAGQAQIDENVEWSYLGTDWPGNIEPNGIFWTGSLWYRSPGERLKLGLSGALSSMKFDPRPGSPLEPGTTDFLYLVGSFQYNAEDWTISAEYAREPVSWRDHGPFFPDRKTTYEGYYLQGTYRIREDVALMLRYEEGFADRSDRDGSRWSAASGGLYPAFSNFFKAWTLGLRWDIRPNVMLRAEFQRNDGTFMLSNRENPDPGQLIRNWDLFALQLAVRF